MYLQKLEIFGFKSFANKSLFKFSSGITAVVGPNGCGKTNVVDAIRWVLGEQKTSVLRSEVMENVIFNGAGNKRPLGFAEVSLTLENTKNILPSEYSEITISRRLFRDGESNYLLNNTLCRLKDIVDLFMDTGMGADSYSVIELKMVEAILSGKPEERRHLFEEAAGVTKYKVKRKEATRKLNYVQSDLVRVEDRVQELEKIVASLARQASKTKRYNKLYNEMSELEAIILKHDVEYYNKDLEKFQNEFKDITSQKEKIEIEIIKDEKDYSTKEIDLIDSDKQLQIAIENENTINNSLSQFLRESAVNEERIKSLGNRISTIKSELENSEKTTASISINIDKVKLDIETKSNSHNDQIEKLKVDNIEKENEFKAINEQRNKVSKSNEALIKIKNSINYTKSEINKYEERRKSTKSKVAESANEIKRLNIDIKLIDESLLKLNTELSEVRESLDKLQERRTSTDKSIALLKEEIENIKTKINESRILLANKKAELNFLKQLEVTDNTVQFLLKNNDWKTANKKDLLIETIECKDEYKIAIDSVLSGYSQFFIVKDESEQIEAVSILKSKDKGKSGFITLNNIPVANPPELINNDKIIGVISELVTVDDKIRNFLRLILGDAVLVSDYEAARYIVNNKIRTLAVTLSGEIYSASGYIKGGSTSRKEGIFVGKIAKIDSLTKEISKTETLITEQESKIKSNQEQIRNLNIEGILIEIKSIENKIQQLERNLSQNNYRKDVTSKNIEIINENAAHFIEEENKITAEIEASKLILEKFESDLPSLELDFKIENEQLASIDKEYHRKSEIAKQSEMLVINSKNDLANLENEKNRLISQSNDLTNKIIKLTDELTSSEITLKETTDKQIDLSVQILQFENNHRESKANRELLHSKKILQEEELASFNTTLNLKRKNSEKLILQTHQIELKISELTTKLASISEKLEENVNLKKKFDEVIVPDDFNITDSKVLIHDLNDKLQSLGSVNFMALEQFDEESKNLDFLKKQVKDLSDSEKTLQETINEINETAKEKFIKTFEEVKRNFKALFKKLFTDEADSDLKLADGDPLECDIEIIAKPPSKKPHSIEMLSSGEKTLTSIALLFGIYLVKPSPFCILDEVDAPLDDTNIDKFITMLREFSIDTQFLIVTHNKRTMEAADTMYGITQQEEGISKIVSVRLENN